MRLNRQLALNLWNINPSKSFWQHPLAQNLCQAQQSNIFLIFHRGYRSPCEDEYCSRQSHCDAAQWCNVGKCRFLSFRKSSPHVLNGTKFTNGGWKRRLPTRDEALCSQWRPDVTSRLRMLNDRQRARQFHVRSIQSLAALIRNKDPKRKCCITGNFANT